MHWQRSDQRAGPLITIPPMPAHSITIFVRALHTASQSFLCLHRALPSLMSAHSITHLRSDEHFLIISQIFLYDHFFILLMN